MASYAEEAWRLLPPESDARPLICIYFAAGLHERLRRAGEPFDLAATGRAIDALTWAEPFIRDPDVHMVAVVLLGHFLAARGQQTGSMADLAAAQPWVLRAADEMAPGDPRWSEMIQTLAAAMTVLASLGMSADHLDRAIELLTAAAGQAGPEPDRDALVQEALGTMLIQRAAFTASEHDADQGIGRLRRAWELTPPGHVGRIALASNLASALLTRFMQRGDAQDIGAAEFYLGAARQLTRTHPDIRSLVADADTIVAGTGGLLALARGLAGDPRALDDAVAGAVAMLPAGHPYLPRLRSDLGYALMARAGRRGGSAAELHEAMQELLAAAGEVHGGHMMRPIAVLRAAAMLVASGVSANDPEAVREAVHGLKAALAALDPRFGDRVRFLGALGAAHQALHQLTGDSADLRSAVRWLEEARRGLATLPGHAQRVVLLTMLAQCYRAGGDLPLARETALAALRERGRDVLLQSGTGRALGTAGLAASQAAEVAAWCVGDGEPAQAVTALELGRGLILHAATAVAGVPEMLTDAGRADLAAEWRSVDAEERDLPWDAEAAVPGSGESLLTSSAPLQVPSDLRARALAVLAGREAEERLLAPPSCAQVAQALAEVGADALVYLTVSPGAPGGWAILVRASCGPDVTVEALELPLLDDGQAGPIADYAAAHTAMIGEAVLPEGPPGPGAIQTAAVLDPRSPGASADREEPPARRWRQSMERLCEWAYPAAMSPLLDHFRQWGLARAPRLVLVPAGRLSLVPWHAALRRADGSGAPRYVCAAVVTSYAASGRQLIEVSRRSALPPSRSPVMLGNPAYDLPFASLEALAIRDGCYPGGRYLGADMPTWGTTADGPGRAGEVLAELPSRNGPGASVLHLGCHAAVLPAAPARSYLALADGERLTIEAILRQAGRRPRDAVGGLVSLAACTSDLAAPQHDEALTLATAFLAAGAVSVVAARWNISDGATSLMMYMFHHFLALEGQSPADALRLAQLWMIDPHRTVPAQLPEVLARHVSSAYAHLTEWAAFTHQGR